MPGMSGFEVIEKIHALDPTITTVVITGFATISSAVEAMKQGAYDFLPKPFTPDEFRLITRRGLEKRELLLETIALRREKEMLRANFTAIVSHELKAPLGAVQQNLFVLETELSGQLRDDQKLKIERMKTRIKELIEIIHTWLRVISVDIEIIKDEFQSVSVHSIVCRAVEIMQSQAVRKNINFVTSFEEPLGSIYGDEGTLTEVLVNLGNNAIKYSYTGSEVLIKASGKDDHIVISVIDTGIGIPKEDQAYVFDDFYSRQLGQTEERGHGLGLALSRRIVEAHDGSISVNSKPGKGSKFVIRLPAYYEGSHQRPQRRPEPTTSP
jgi:signal transduction histidine kinase